MARLLHGDEGGRRAQGDLVARVQLDRLLRFELHALAICAAHEHRARSSSPDRTRSSRRVPHPRPRAHARRTHPRPPPRYRPRRVTIAPMTAPAPERIDPVNTAGKVPVAHAHEPERPRLLTIARRRAGICRRAIHHGRFRRPHAPAQVLLHVRACVINRNLHLAGAPHSPRTARAAPPRARPSYWPCPLGEPASPRCDRAWTF